MDLREDVLPKPSERQEKPKIELTAEAIAAIETTLRKGKDVEITRNKEGLVIREIEATKIYSVVARA